MNAVSLVMTLMVNDEAAVKPSVGSQLREAFVGTIEKMKLPGIEVLPVVMPCGQVNAGYVPKTHELIMCAETLSEGPDVVRFITAHEMAHAIIDQYRLPIPGSEEEAADELAAVYLGMTGQTQTILNIAIWDVQHPSTPNEWDDHPSNSKRAATLICLGDGAEDDSLIVECRRKFLRAELTWTRLIAAFGPQPVIQVPQE